MKKLISLLAICMFCTVVQAQKLTEKDLLGKWSLSGTEMAIGYADFKDHSFTPSMAMEKEIAPQDREAFKTKLFASMPFNGSTYMQFKPGNIVSTNIGPANEHVYKITTQGERQFFENADKPDDVKSEIYIREGKLQIITKDPNGGNVIIIFEKG